MFFAVRLKDLYSYGYELLGDQLVFINSSQFVLLKNGKMNLYDIDGFQFKEVIPFKV